MTETTSPPGRVTWRGPCPIEGCYRPVVCRRVKTTERAPGQVIDLTVPTTTEVTLPSGQPIRKVTAYRDDEPPTFHQPDPEPPGPGAGGDSPGVQAPADVDQPDDEPGDVDDGDPGGPAGALGRLRARRAKRRRHAGPGEPVAELIPGIY